MTAGLDATTEASIADRLEQAGRGSFLGLRLPDDFDPVALLTAPEANDVRASYERPDSGLALVAVGEAGRATSPPGDGPRGAYDAARELLAAPARVDSPALRPRLLGGFAFRDEPPPQDPWSGFGCGSLLLPRLLFVRDGEARGVVIAPGIDPDEARELIGRAVLAPAPRRPADDCGPLKQVRSIDREQWLASVDSIATEVRAGVYEKVVLATSLVLDGECTIDVGATLARLRVGYPECHLFTYHAGGATFLGASPELLVALHEGDVTALGLAGSARRGATDDEDERIGRELLASGKDRIEHESVVRAIREGLDGLTERLRAPNQPGLRRLRNIQHLATEITGRVARGVDVLDLVQRLHPTPAVCGWPKAAAQHVIAVLESFDRGWYAGPIGWLDARGDGEFAVGLRSALVRGSRAWLFAGNGIMGDSDPEAELAEVQLKFRPLADALGGAAG